MTGAPRFSLRSAVVDSVSTGRREETTPAPTEEMEAASEPTAPPASRRSSKTTKPTAKTVRPTTRQGARGITVWVEPEVYRMVKLAGLDADQTTQDLMLEAIDDLLAKRGKGRLAKTR